MNWLCKLVCPPGGIILDPFAGSGTTGISAVKNGFHYILIDAEEEYCRIAESRIAHARAEVAKVRQEEMVSEWECHPSCPIRILGEQSGVSKDTTHRRGKEGSAKFNGKYNHGDLYANGSDQYGGYSDTGTAARFFQQFPPASLWDEVEEVAE